MKKIVSLVLAAVMLLSLCAMEALALNAGETAEDGVYSSSVTVTKRSDGKLKYYYGTVYVTVSDGVISNMTVYASDKQSRFNDLLNSVKGSYIGKPATLETCSGIDAVSSASVGGSGCSSGKYSSDMIQAIERALASAPAKAGSQQDASGVADGVYTGTGSMANGHFITLDVTVSDEKITNIVIRDADGSWDSLLDQVRSAYLGSVANAEVVDAVTSATPQGYRACIADAIKNALGSAPNGGGTDPSGNGVQVLELEKTLNVQAAETPSAAFRFTFTSTDANAPQIAPQTITFGPEDAAVSGRATKRVSVTIPADALHAAGTFTYIVREAADTFQAQAGERMVYDTAAYQVKLKFCKTGDGKYEPCGTEIRRLDDSGAAVGEKCDALLFENTYSKVTDGTLTVRKTVSGRHADSSRDFSYTITFTDPDGVSSGKAPTVTIDGAAETLSYGTPKSFALKDGQSLAFSAPVGTTYTITEAAAPNYLPSAAVTAGDTRRDESGQSGQALTISGSIVDGTNAADFTNTYDDNPLTGVAERNAPFLILMLAAVLAAAGIALDRRRRRA